MLTLNDFTTVFLFSKNVAAIPGEPLWKTGVGLLLFVAPIVTLQWLRLKNASADSKTLLSISIFITLFIGTSIFISHVSSIMTEEQRYQSLLNIYNNRQYKVVEGPVHVIHEQPASGHDDGDIVEVGGTRLEVDYFSGGPGYTDTIAYNGVLREGTYARIYYFYDSVLQAVVILRIDLRY
jgi:hypothetical protein